MTLPEPLPKPDPSAELRESFIRFVHENSSEILRYLTRICFDPHLAEDALQEALIVTMSKWDVVSTHQQPLYWVRRTAFHKLSALQDRQKWKNTVSLDNLGLDMAEPASTHDAELVLRQALSQLPVRQRAVLALTVEGATDEEIAVQLDLATTTVRTYKCEVRKKCRELFRSDDGGGRHGLR